MRNTHLATNYFLFKMNHTNLSTLANTHLDNLFKQNGNDEWFMAKFPYEFDKVDRYWQIDECHINPSLNSKPMILVQCQLIYQNLTVATYRLYFDTDYQLIDEFFLFAINHLN